MQSHLCNVMQKLHSGHIHCESCRTTERKAGVGPGSGVSQNEESEAILQVQGAEAQRGRAERGGLDGRMGAACIREACLGHKAGDRGAGRGRERTSH